MIKKLRSLLIKTQIRLAQRTYKRLTYLYQPGKSDTLIVSFSGFGGNHTPARYNYISTLKSVNAHRLFILDNFGYQKQGSYYLGENGDWFVPALVTELICKIQTEKQIKKTIMIGSSKGGTAALFYGIKLGADACVIGAPQYYCGDYLAIDKHLPILEGIMGNTDPASIDALNCVVKDCVFEATSHKPTVYIHYSPQEHTYPEHIADMIRDLKQNGYTVVEDAEYTYTEHGDVAMYFPSYLLRTVKAQLKS